MRKCVTSIKDMRNYFIFALLFCFPFFEYPSLAQAPDSNQREESPESVDFPNLTVPTYQRFTPNWGIGVVTSLNAFGGNALTTSQGSNPSFAFSLLGEYQPSFLQHFGMIGIGPRLSVYPITSGGVTPSAFSNLGAGGQIRYQLRLFREQPIVPSISYLVEYFKYQFSDGTVGSLVIKGPSIGVWVLLNFLEPSSAANMYMSTGISRNYAVLEWTQFQGQDGNIQISGGSTYFGLRFEF